MFYWHIRDIDTGENIHFSREHFKIYGFVHEDISIYDIYCNDTFRILSVDAYFFLNSISGILSNSATSARTSFTNAWTENVTSLHFLDKMSCECSLGLISMKDRLKRLHSRYSLSTYALYYPTFLSMGMVRDARRWSWKWGVTTYSRISTWYLQLLRWTSNVTISNIQIYKYLRCNHYFGHCNERALAYFLASSSSCFIINNVSVSFSNRQLISDCL